MKLPRRGTPPRLPRTTADLSATISETAWQETVIEAAHLHGWLVAHFRPVRIQREDGSVYYATPVAADGKGWPDLVLVRAGHAPIYVELKTDVGTLSPEQKMWARALRAADADYRIWRPGDSWEAIEGVLR